MYWEKYNTKPWNPDEGKNICEAKSEILNIIKDQKVSLAQVRFLFDEIICEIEENNIVNL